MLIRTRLSLVFSFIASGLFILFGAFVYYYSSVHRNRDFLNHLKERVEITEKIFLEKESFTDEEFEKIRKQFLHTLPEETEEVLELGGNEAEKFSYEYPAGLRKRLLEEESLEFKWGDKRGVSRVFRVKGKDYLIIVTARDETGQRYLTDLRKIILSLLLFGIPLIFVSSYFVTRQTLMPILRKIERANSISASNLHQRLEVLNPNDEIGRMAIAFNQLLDRLETSFEAQKAFIRNASHEIRNPLTAILGEAEVALNRKRNDREYKDALKAILYEAEILNQTVSNLLQLSRVQVADEQISFEMLDMRKFIPEVMDSYAFQNPDHQIKLNCDEADKPLPVKGNRSLLLAAFSNIVDNACKFSDNQPVEVRMHSSGSGVNITIIDRGFGILKEDMAKVSTPFFRGSNAMGIKGSGIGLSLSVKIIELHKGTLEIQSEPGKGTRVMIFLPLI